MLGNLKREIDQVAKDKGIDSGEIISALEEAMKQAARRERGQETEIEARFNEELGEVELFEFREVVESVDDESTQITLADAAEFDPEAELGDEIGVKLDTSGFGRILAQTAKQVIIQRIREAERDTVFEEYKDRADEIVNGIVRRFEKGAIIVDLGRAEAVLPLKEQVPRENYRPNDRLRAYVVEVNKNAKGSQIVLSRTCIEMLTKLFEQEVPEMYEKIVSIESAAREPGGRSKIAVASRDNDVDPVGACVGMKGSRVQAVVQELQGEKIDIIPWSEDTATFVVNALQPATVSRVVLDEEEGRIEVVVPEDQLSLAIGRRGQNVRLASQLTGHQIDIMTEDEASEKRSKEFAERSKMFEEELDVDETLSQLLVAEGFAELEEVAYVELAELASIEGFDEELAEELQNRAIEAIERQTEAYRSARKELGVEDDLAEIPHLTEEMLVVLGKAGILTLDDLADLATDELIAKKREAPRRRQSPDGPPMRRPQRPEDKGGVLGTFGLSEEQGNEIIMAARAHWFDDEPEAAPATEEAADAESSQ